MQFDTAAACAAACAKLRDIGFSPCAAEPVEVTGRLHGVPFMTDSSLLSEHFQLHAWRVGIAPSLRVTRILQRFPAEHYSSDCYFSVSKAELRALLSIPPLVLSGRAWPLSWDVYDKVTPIMRSSSSAPEGQRGFCSHCRSVGHLRAACPDKNIGNAGGFNDACFQCRSFDHGIKNCPHLGEACVLCGKGAHSTMACPLTRGSYKPLAAMFAPRSAQHNNSNSNNNNINTTQTRQPRSA